MRGREPIRRAGLLVVVAALLLAGEARADSLLFGPNELVTASEDSTSNSAPVVRFTPDGVAHLVWVLGPPDEERVVVVEAEAGAEYGPLRVLSEPPLSVAGGEFRGPTLRVVDDVLAAGWQNRQDVADPAVWTALSSDAGASWGAPVRADPAGGLTPEEFLDFQAVGLFPDGRLAQVWMITDRTLGQTRYVWSAQDGLGDFAPPRDVSAAVEGQPCECCYPDQLVLDDGATVLVAYRGNIDDRRDIHVVRSTDGGASFAERIDVDTLGWVVPACPASGPTLASEGRTVLVTWMSGAGGEQHAWLARSTDGGATWTSPMQLDDTDGTLAPNYPRVTLRDGVAVVVWQQRLSGNEVIAAVLSTDGGLTWTTPTLVSDRPAGRKRSPAVALSPSGAVEVAWADQRLGPWRIFRASGRVLPDAAPWVLREALSDPLDRVLSLLPFLFADGMEQYDGLFGQPLPWLDPEPVLSPGSDRTIVYYRLDDPSVPVIRVEPAPADETVRLVAGP